MSFRALFTLLGVSFGALHCGGGPAPAAPPKGAPAAAAVPPGAAPAGARGGKKEDIQALFVRERAPLPAAAVADPAGRWRAKIEAKGAPVVTAKQGMTTIEANVGTASEVTCFVYDDTIDAASSLTHLLGELKKGGIEARQVAASRVGSINHVPFVALRALYQVQQNGEPAMGDIKLAVSPRPEHPFICMQDEPGYVAAFDRTVEAFARSLEVENPSARAPRYAAVWESQIDGLPVGFTWERLYDEADGSTTDLTISSEFLPVGPGELRTSDGLTMNKHYATGLAEGTFISFENAEKEYQIELKRQGNKGYRYSGDVQGKAVSGTFRVEGGLFDDYDLIQRLKKAKGSARAESFVAHEYHPALDPTRPLEVRYQIDPGANLVGVSLGKLDMSIEVRDGQRTKITMPMGPRQFVSKLLDQQGKL